MKTCLIVDDSRIIRKISRQILESVGFACNEAENGQVALDHCRQAMPNFILLDWNMPVMDGMGFVHAMRGLPGGKAPVVVFCSTENSPERIQMALDAGADEYIMKPFDADIIRDKLEQLELIEFMKPEDFDLFATLVKQRSGLILTREKAYLLESRLLPVVRKYSLKSLEEMAHQVRSHRDETLMHDITEAMTTNESSFFRDRRPFRQFRDILLPQLLASRATRRQIRIWSAAAAGGQEAYSVAMICAEAGAALQGWKVDIIGTDISRMMIEQAKAGIYSHFDVQRGLPIRMLIKYFRQTGPDKWQIKDELRQMVQFRESNLLHDFGAVGVFDVVFCRNVLIYFDSPTQTRVINAVGSVMAQDGILMLGAGETVSAITDKFRAADDLPELYVLSALQGSGLARQIAV